MKLLQSIDVSEQREQGKYIKKFSNSKASHPVFAQLQFTCFSSGRIYDDDDQWHFHGFLLSCSLFSMDDGWGWMWKRRTQETDRERNWEVVNKEEKLLTKHRKKRKNIRIIKGKGNWWKRGILWLWNVELPFFNVHNYDKVSTSDELKLAAVLR